MDKKTGYALLWGGVAVIVCSIWLAWRVFSGSVPPPELVNIQSIVLPLPSMQVAMPLDPQISKTANISLYFMFIFFVSAAGGRIANLGIKLINPAKQEDKKPEPKP